MAITQISVLALDAVDHQLARDFNCDQLLLDTADELETDEWSADYPSTKEVWPSVATGVTPDKHGLILFDNDGEKSINVKFSNPLVRIARRFKGVIPLHLRKPISRRIRSNTEMELEQTDLPHMFDDVYMWPGITGSTHLTRAHNILNRTLDHDITEHQLEEEILDLTLNEFQWLAHADGEITGAHSHILDVSGHVYAQDREALKQYYHRVNELIGWLRLECDELVILSDHGMQVGWLDDAEPGQHSYRAMVSATSGLDGLPETIYEVRSWIESHEIVSERVERQASLDSTEEQLESLGYL